MRPSNCLGLLALGDLRAGAGRGVEAGNAGAAGADALGQRALRVELDLQLAGQVLLREGGVLADIGADHLAHLPRLQQHAEADIVDARVVGDDGEVLHAAVADRLDQRGGNAAQAEAAGHDRHAVAQQPGQRRLCVRIDLVDRHRARLLRAHRATGPEREARDERDRADPTVAVSSAWISAASVGLARRIWLARRLAAMSGTAGSAGLEEQQVRRRRLVTHLLQCAAQCLGARTALVSDIASHRCLLPVRGASSS